MREDKDEHSREQGWPTRRMARSGAVLELGGMCERTSQGLRVGDVPAEWRLVGLDCWVSGGVLFSGPQCMLMMEQVVVREEMFKRTACGILPGWSAFPEAVELFSIPELINPGGWGYFSTRPDAVRVVR